MTRDAALPWLALIVFGAGWGLMQPMTKIAVDGGFEPFGIMVWQGADPAFRQLYCNRPYSRRPSRDHHGVDPDFRACFGRTART